MQVDSIAGHGVLSSFSLGCIYGNMLVQPTYSYGMLNIELKYVKIMPLPFLNNFKFQLQQ